MCELWYQFAGKLWYLSSGGAIAKELFDWGRLRKETSETGRRESALTTPGKIQGAIGAIGCQCAVLGPGVS